MSRNKNVDYTQYIHEFVDERGVQRFAVAERVNGQYSCPVDIHTFKLTGCGREFGSLKYLGGYLTRRQALRRARYLFGGK
ncbi:MAG: hypothetical protein WC554_10995 [Clostridia bacterium]|jgi:hypothetical protein